MWRLLRPACRLGRRLPLAAPKRPSGSGSKAKQTDTAVSKCSRHAFLYRHAATAPAPLPGRLVKYARTRRVALAAAAIRIQVPCREIAPVAPDQDGLAVVTVGALAGRIVRVAGEHVS